jgi:hypothetical protein
MISRVFPANRSFPRFSTKISPKNSVSTAVLAVIPALFSLQVVVMGPVMNGLTSGKKYAKKLKKTLYICRKKGDDVFRCLQKAQLKKRWKKPLTGFL